MFATWEAHPRLLEDMFRALQTAGLKLKPSKIHFGPKEVQYIGHLLSANGIRMGEDRIKAIIDLKTPTAIKNFALPYVRLISYGNLSQIWQK